jgi:hypothetical protein
VASVGWGAVLLAVQSNHCPPPELDGSWACAETDGMSDPRPGSRSGRRENLNPKTSALPPTTTLIRTIPAISTVTHQGMLTSPVGRDGSYPKNTLVTEVYPNQIGRATIVLCPSNDRRRTVARADDDHRLTRIKLYHRAREFEQRVSVPRISTWT